jgi:Ca-activated chloride channel family protein
MKKFIIIVLILNSGSDIYAQDSNSLVNRGNQYYQQSQFDVAEIMYRKALKDNSKNFAAQFNLANSLQKQKKYEDAINILERLADETNDQPLKSSVYYNEGVAYTKSKDLEKSIEYYKKALIYNQADKEARENLQKALLELKQQQQQKKNQQSQNKKQQKMNDKDAEQKLKMLEQKEKDLQQRLQNQNKQKGNGQREDW